MIVQTASVRSREDCRAIVQAGSWQPDGYGRAKVLVATDLGRILEGDYSPDKVDEAKCLDEMLDAIAGWEAGAEGQPDGFPFLTTERLRPILAEALAAMLRDRLTPDQ